MNNEANEALKAADLAIKNSTDLWGEHLPRLVPADLAGKWFIQWAQFNDAIVAGNDAGIVTHAGGVSRGLGALDTAARKAGHKPPGPVLFQFTTPDGVDIAIVSDAADRAKSMDRAGAVFTIDELGRIMDDAGADFAASIKQLWPGATIKDVKRVGDAQHRNPKEFDDNIPF